MLSCLAELDIHRLQVMGCLPSPLLRLLFHQCGSPHHNPCSSKGDTEWSQGVLQVIREVVPVWQ